MQLLKITGYADASHGKPILSDVLNEIFAKQAPLFMVRMKGRGILRYFQAVLKIRC